MSNLGQNVKRVMRGHCETESEEVVAKAVCSW